MKKIKIKFKHKNGATITGVYHLKEKFSEEEFIKSLSTDLKVDWEIDEVAELE